jgi:hypothetical protein
VFARHRARQAECEADTDGADPSSGRAGEGSGPSAARDDGAAHDRGGTKKRVVEIRGDHISAVAAELLLDFS